MRIIVGISGATGALSGIRTVEVLSKLNMETHLIVSDAGLKTINLVKTPHLGTLS